MHRTSAILALILGSSLASPALAQDWGSFGSAFKLLPCPDGWAGCRLEGQVVQADLVTDSEGMPTPAHMRVGWFDLKATPSFSPFTELSEYTGELPYASSAAVADAGGDAEEEYVEPSAADIEAEMSDDDRAAVAEAAEAREAERRAAQESRAAQAAADDAKRKAEASKRAEEEARKKAEAEKARAAELERQRKAAEAKAASDAAAAAELARLKKEEEAARKAAAEAEAKRKAEEAARQKAEAERKRQEEEARKKAEAEAKAAAAAEAKRKAEEEARKRAEAEAKRKAEEEAKRKAEEEAKAKAAAANDGSADAADVGGAPPAGGGGCGIDELVRLEPQAMLGKLPDGTIAACEQTLASTPKMTDKKKVSLLLQVNAFSKGDKATWEKLVKRHLNELDQSDPDLCYKYALHLSKKGASRASGVIRWANTALENRIVWTGDTYTSRVNSLYKLRASAAQSLWMGAEQSHSESPSDETAGKVDKYRAMTKVMAREWYEYAKVAGKDTTKALQLCMSAAGTKDYCEAG